MGLLGYNTSNIIITDYFFNVMEGNEHYCKNLYIKEAEHIHNYTALTTLIIIVSTWKLLLYLLKKWAENA